MNNFEIRTDDICYEHEELDEYEEEPAQIEISILVRNGDIEFMADYAEGYKEIFAQFVSVMNSDKLLYRLIDELPNLVEDGEEIQSKVKELMFDKVNDFSIIQPCDMFTKDNSE